MEPVLLLALVAILALLVLLLVVYLFDINYFIRVAFVYILAYFRRRPLDFLDASVTYGRVLPFDSDVQLLHMNNARVLREYDFGRLDLWTRTGLLDDHLKGLKVFELRPVFAVATVIRYRRPLHMFMKYKIITRVAYWEGKVLYQEQKMVTLNDNMTRNLGYCKVIFPFNLDEFVKQRYPLVEKPKPPRDLALWMQYNEANGMNTKVRKASVKDDPLETDEWSSPNDSN